MLFVASSPTHFEGKFTCLGFTLDQCSFPLSIDRVRMEDYLLDTFWLRPHTADYLHQIPWWTSTRNGSWSWWLLHLAIVRQNRTTVRTNDIKCPTVAIITSWEVTGATNKDIAERRWQLGICSGNGGKTCFTYNPPNREAFVTGNSSVYNDASTCHWFLLDHVNTHRSYLLVVSQSYWPSSALYISRIDRSIVVEYILGFFKHEMWVRTIDILKGTSSAVQFVPEATALSKRPFQRRQQRLTFGHSLMRSMHFLL